MSKLKIEERWETASIRIREDLKAARAKLLAEGWEPFAVIYDVADDSQVLWLRRRLA